MKRTNLSDNMQKTLDLARKLNNNVQKLVTTFATYIVGHQTLLAVSIQLRGYLLHHQNQNGDGHIAVAIANNLAIIIKGYLFKAGLKLLLFLKN